MVLALAGLVVVVVFKVMLFHVQIQCLNAMVTCCLCVCGVFNDVSQPLLQ